MNYTKYIPTNDIGIYLNKAGFNLFFNLNEILLNIF